MSSVEVLLTLGKLDASLALLTTSDHHVIEFPTVLLPDNVKAGSIVKLSVSQSLDEEERQREVFKDIQSKILEKYGTHRPKPPVLKIVNITQTNCVLGWDPLHLGSARLKSLTLYRQGVRSTVIPSPFKSTTTKISGLSVDTAYDFQLKLSTTSGQYWSEKVEVHTHKMTDMSGITVCLGQLDPLQSITEDQIAYSLMQIGARPLQHHVAIDTTHFVTNDPENEEDPELIKAKNSNIPVVRPEWVKASETEKRIVGVRGFYLDADEGILKSYPFTPLTEESKGQLERQRRNLNTEEGSSLKASTVEKSANTSEEAVVEDNDEPTQHEVDVEALHEEPINEPEAVHEEPVSESEVEQPSIEQTETYVAEESNVQTTGLGLSATASPLEETETNVEAEEPVSGSQGIEEDDVQAMEIAPEAEVQSAVAVDDDESSAKEVVQSAVPEVAVPEVAVPEVAISKEAVPEDVIRQTFADGALAEREVQSTLEAEPAMEAEVESQPSAVAESDAVPEMKVVPIVETESAIDIPTTTGIAEESTTNPIEGSEKAAESSEEIMRATETDAEGGNEESEAIEKAVPGVRTSDEFAAATASVESIADAIQAVDSNSIASDEKEASEQPEDTADGSGEELATAEKTDDNTASSKSKKKKNKKKKNKKK
ncbi:hypothetical protein HG535_0E03470 [Zygotorulaspora mrakii]|uniref:Chitin biosynthesis protein CHS5 n=1 Tax=Zygotorulaspora mrakii TaxID=42260 RepID=A0A7H9B492_ZYGMR|nr:uncharacterized protein HG535_0E03470 [Zygotorulaspora mrakii]QLG73263.1 hypothetical protein HG535_0E03470 [Zygotorulaspora mrakii]